MNAIEEAQLYAKDGKFMETEEQLLKAIWNMVSLVCDSNYKFWQDTNNKYILDTELLEIVKPYLKGDLDGEMFLGNLVRVAMKHFNCSQDEALLKSFVYVNQLNSDEEVHLVRTFSEAADMLEVIDGRIVYPEKWFSPAIYKNISEILKTFDFDRIKYNKRVAYSPYGEFKPEQTLKILKELNGLSLSDKYEYYPTPPELVKIVQELLEVKETDSILEPSAGVGNLVEGLNKEQVTCVELNELLASILKEKGYKTQQCSFEDFSSAEKFDKIIMNPPFAKRLDAQHIVRAFEECLKEGGLLVAIHSTGILNASDKHSKKFQELYKNFGVHQLITDSGAFKESGKGTNVSTAISVLCKD